MSQVARFCIGLIIAAIGVVVWDFAWPSTKTPQPTTQGSARFATHTTLPPTTQKSSWFTTRKTRDGISFLTRPVVSSQPAKAANSPPDALIAHMMRNKFINGIALRKSHWKGIVLHHSASDTSSYEAIDRDHSSKGWDGIGYHFTIDSKGVTTATMRWINQRNGAHCKGHNDYIGICLLGDFQYKKPTKTQLQYARSLVRTLCKEFGFSAQQVHGHNHFRSTKCPGSLKKSDVL